MYQPRTYRHWIKGKNLVSFNVVVKETDLYISATTNLSEEAIKLVGKCRDSLEAYIARHPAFLTSLEPFPVDKDAPCMVREMAEAAIQFGC